MLHIFGKAAMEFQRLLQEFDCVSSTGIILSIEQKTALQTSLPVLKAENKFRGLFFWGKIIGLARDYYIAKGVGENYLKDVTYYYSQDCLKWNLLPKPDEERRQKSRQVTGRFTGDPAYEFEIKEIQTDQAEPVMITVKEEDRLATTIDDVNDEAAIIPRGSYLRTPKGIVKPNRSFDGLCFTDAMREESYLHFCMKSNLQEQLISLRADADQSLDFLTPIVDDIPLGCWSIQSERGSVLVIIRNHAWPGYTFYHVPGTSTFGSIYYGLGEKNVDLPFML